MYSREARARYNKTAVEKALKEGLCPRCKALPPKLDCKHCQDCIDYFVAYKALRRKKHAT
jgi:uncharacterized OB-fold protein